MKLNRTYNIAVTGDTRIKKNARQISIDFSSLYKSKKNYFVMHLNRWHGDWFVSDIRTAGDSHENKIIDVWVFNASLMKLSKITVPYYSKASKEIIRKTADLGLAVPLQPSDYVVVNAMPA